MTEIEHIDATGLGLLLVAAVSLPLALSNLILDGDVSKYPAGDVATLLGALIILTGIAAYMANNTFAMTVLVLVGIAVLFSGTGDLGVWGAIVFGIIFLFFIYWAYSINAAKLLVILLVTTALIFLLVGVIGIATVNGSSTSGLSTVLGVVALLNFIFTFWLGAGMVTEGKIPYF